MAIRKIKLPGEQEPRDIGANSSNIIYDGDQGVTTTLNSKIQSIFTAIGDINSFEIALVNALPTENIDDHTIYFVPESESSTTHNEYMYIDNQWELIGTTTIDLSNYLQKSDISVTSNLNSGTNIGSITIDGTTTTFYAPVATSDIFVLTTHDAGEFPWTTDKTYAELFTSVSEEHKAILLNVDGFDEPCTGIYDGTMLFGPWETVYEEGVTQLTDYVQVIPSNKLVNKTYTMSMTGPTINLLADGVAASTITLPIWDGTLD